MGVTATINNMRANLRPLYSAIVEDIDRAIRSSTSTPAIASTDCSTSKKALNGLDV
jgi:hypothetical protein